MAAEVVAVSVGRPQVVTLRHGGEDSTAIVKTPVEGPVMVSGVNLEGDDQADRTVHGGEHQAVYAYAEEDLAWWADVTGLDLTPGAWFGENLTTRGLDLAAAVIGEVWAVGDELELEVTSPRIPCGKLAWRMGDGAFQKRFVQAARSGAYLRIAREGRVRAGDAVEVVLRPAHGVTVAEAFAALTSNDRSLAARVLQAPQLHPRMREWAQDRAA